ncbi:hypothetical protein [Dokdonia sp.]|uniref:hypothetical protein n=1 Tax=Dokdonia sp. TaxID=2024995 RepID=UPI0032637DA9
MKKLLLIICFALLLPQLSIAQCGPGEDTQAPVFGDAGDGTMANPFRNLLLATVGGVPSGTYYFNFNGSTFQGALDNDTDGGGWLMVLNYVHLAGDNTDLTVRNTDLPLLGSSTVGDNEAGTANWGHMGNALATAIDFEEVRLYGETTGHGRIINFKTSYVNVLTYLKTGLGNFASIMNATNFTALSGHTANIPAQAINAFSSQGDNALTEFPFFRSGQFHWGIRGLGNRWEVDDSALNTQSTIHRVWVRGDLSPTATTTLTTTLDTTGNITINPTDFGLVVTDNCSAEANINISLSQTDFTCADIGANTIQFTATDEQNNNVTIDATVTIVESPPIINTPPTFPFFEVELDSNGEVTLDLTILNTAVTDDCGIASTIISQTDFNCSNIGFNSVAITATDVNGNVTTENLFFVLTDPVPPIIQCVAPFSIELDTTGSVTLDPNSLLASFTDNCGAGEVTLDKSVFTCADIGDNLVTITARDQGGNETTCTTTVTITIPSCPGDLTLQAETDTCGVTYNYPCASNITAGPPSGTFLDVGTTTTFTYDTLDNMGATVSCSYDVTVIDEDGPIFEAQNITLDIAMNGMASLTATDLLGPDPLAPDYTVDQTATLNREDISTTGTEIILNDDEVSSALPIGFEFAFYGNLYNDFYISSNGFITFTTNSDDGCCNGQLLPNISTPNNLIAFDWNDINPEDGGTIRYETIGTSPNRTLIMDWDNVTHIDDSNDVTTTQVKLFETSNRIEIHTTIIPLTADDKTQGLENIDGTAAILVPGRNAAQWSATNDVVAFIPISGIIDGCGVDTLVASQTTFDCSNVGENTVTVTATDTNGNITEKTAIVTITDTLDVCSDLNIAPKVFLQGAGINPVTGEETLMRDNLRTNGVLPTTSPYSDSLTVDPVVFTVTGNDAIVDWVWVELRDATDRTIVIAGQSALLQRDGDIVTTDGVSSLSFSGIIASYHIKINHRSHLGITTANPIALDAMTTTLDFTVDTATTNGGAIALIPLSNGNLALLAGDGNGDGSILNTDIVNALQASGTSGYLDNDANMDSFILNSDIQLIIQPNAGKIEQE